MRPAEVRDLMMVISLSVVSANAAAQSKIPVRELEPVAATAGGTFRAILGIRELSDGRVLVNDGRSRQLLMFDATLQNRTVVLDSVPTNGQGYGPRASPIIAHLADTTLFVDGESRTLLVVGPSGTVARVASAPKPGDLGGLAYATSGVDTKGNLVYLVRSLIDNDMMKGSRRDSATIVRANFETRTVDTLGRVKLPDGEIQTDTTINGRLVVTRVITALKTLDEWTVLSNGTVAMVRGGDYHVDLLRPDGKIVNGPKLAFDWKRLSDTDKQVLMDSAKAAYDAEEKDTMAAPSFVSAAALQAANNGGPRLSKSTAPKMIKLVAPMSSIPDYWPPIRPEAAKADRDTNMWILPTTSAQSLKGELVYDVVNSRGEMTERVRVPVGRSIAGFGRNGTVYLMYTNADGRWVLERTRVAR